MSTTADYIEYVMDQLRSMPFEFRYKKIFGEYCVYANDKPIFLVWDDTVFAKKIPSLSSILHESETGTPYIGAKLHYVIDIEDAELISKVIPLLEQNISVPKSKSRKNKQI